MAELRCLHGLFLIEIGGIAVLQGVESHCERSGDAVLLLQPTAPAGYAPSQGTAQHTSDQHRWIILIKLLYSAATSDAGPMPKTDTKYNIHMAISNVRPSIFRSVVRSLKLGMRNRDLLLLTCNATM